MVVRTPTLAEWLAPYATAFDIIECADQDAWLAERRKGVGASEMAVLLGLCDWASPFSLWAQKTGKVPVDNIDSDILEWGRFMEEPTAQRYAYRTKRELRDLGRYTILRSKQWPWIFCTLDRVITALPTEGVGFEMHPIEPWMVGPGCLEIKAPTIYGYHNWDEGAPLHYQAQLQTQLAVSGLQWGSFGAQMPTGKFDAIDQQRNDAFIAVAVEKSRAFWDCVENDTWPPVDGSSWTGAALKAMFPRSNGAKVDLPTDAAIWHAEFEAAKEREKEAKAAKDMFANKIKAVIGDGLYGVIQTDSGEVFYKYGEVNKDSYVVKAQHYRELRKVKGIE